ncbi:MAG: DsbA family protein [Hyphomicrobiaceae bacterium]
MKQRGKAARGIIAALLSAGLAVGLSACAGEQLLSVGNATPEPAQDSAASSPYGASATTTAASGPLDAMSLSGQVSGRPPGGREVIAAPTEAEITKTGTLPEMAWGRQDAPVTVVKYMSLTCPYCRKFHLEVFPAFKKKYIDTGKVRFIIREFPIGRSSGNATIALRCAPPEKYLDLYGRFLSQQSSWVSQEVRLDAIFKVAQQVGMTRARFDACLVDQPMIDGLRWVKDRGRTLGIIGTPNFFVAGKLVKRVLSLDDLSGLVDAALTGKGGGAAAATAAR